MHNWFSALFGCCLVAASPAQEVLAFRSNVELVVVPFQVVDARGAMVNDLTRDEFRVFDNGTPRVIRNFWIDRDVPLTLGVIVDASVSQEEQVAEHRRTVVDLLQGMLRPGDQAFVISIAEDVRVWADLTGDVEQIRKLMAAPPGDLLGEPCPRRQIVAGVPPISACGSTPLWNAVYDAARLKLHALTGSKALIVLTDGFDSGSTHTWRQAADAANRAETSVYAVQYRSASGRSYAPDLYRLVEEAGGTVFSSPAGVVSRLETDLRRRYVLGFQPEKVSGKVRHEVRVETARPSLTVRARKTYFEDAPR